MSRCTTWSIVRLADVPETIPVLAGWFRQAWRPYYGAAGPGNAESDLKACLGRGSLPIGFVALGADRAPIGTASLIRTSVGTEEFSGPWLGALVVAEQCRGCGVATDLVFAIEAEARRLGFPALYASVNPTSTLLRRCGWNVLGSASSLQGSMAVFGKYLI